MARVSSAAGEQDEEQMNIDDFGGRRLVTDDGRDVSECTCGADLIKSAELGTELAPEPGARQPHPAMYEIPACTCGECGKNIGAVYGTEAVVAVWDALGETLPGHDDSVDGERLVTDGGEPADDDVVNDDDDDLEFDYTRLWYIKLRDEDDRRPMETWGGYDQDFEDADTVYAHDEVVESDHQWWGVVGWRDETEKMSRELLIFDIDAYKMEDPEAALDDFRYRETLITRSQNGGLHVWQTLTARKGEWKETDFDVNGDVPIDIRGSTVSHHVVAPSDIPGVGGSYSVTGDFPVRNMFTLDGACDVLVLDDEPVVEYSPDAAFGGDEGDSESYTPEGEEWLLPSDIEDALEHIPANLGYSEWRDIIFAVADFYARVGADREDAVATAEEWSKTAPDAFDDETERHIWNIVQSGYESVKSGDDTRITAGTLIHVARRNGWDLPDKKTRLAIQTVDDFIDEYKPESLRGGDDDDDDGPGDEELSELARAVPDLNDDQYENRADDIVDRVSVSRTQIDEHRELAEMRDGHGDIVNYNGALSRIHGRWLSASPIFNFEFDVESILELPGDDEGRSSVVSVSPSEPNEPEFEIDVEPRIFNDARRFKDTVLSQAFSTVIESSSKDAVVMDMVRQYIAAQDVPVRIGQYEMGLSEGGDEFVTPNGTIGADGWMDEPDHVHVNQGSKTNATVRAFGAKPEDNIDKGDCAEMLELASQSRLPDRIIPILSWFAAAPFRKAIFEQTGTFNPLGVFGRSGSGKTATLAALSQMWGMSNEPLSVNASKFATLTGFTSSRGVPVWFDEYRPEKTPDYIMDRWHTYYKKAATGGVEPRGNQGMGTDDWHLRSPIVVSGESEISSDAERRRTIAVGVTSEPTQEGHPARDAFKDLVGDVTTDEAGNVEFPEAEFDLQDFGVKYYSWVASMSDTEFTAAWHDARETVAKFAAEHEDDIDLGDTELQGLQTVVFGYRRLVSFARTVGAELSALPSPEDLEDALELVADVDGDGRQPHEHQFFSLVSRAASAGYVEENKDYRVIHEGEPNEELRVNVTRAFDKVSKFVRDHDLNADLLNSASDYKSRFEDLEDGDTFVTTTRQGTQGIARCTGVSMSRAVEDISGFDRESFVDVDDADEGEDGEAVDDDGDGGGDGPTPLSEIADIDDYCTVTAKVVEWDATPDGVVDAGGPVESGSLVDVTGRRDVVTFDRGASPEGMEHMAAGETVRIENAEVSEYDGRPQLTLDAGTVVSSIQKGVGHTAGETPAEGQSTVDEAAPNQGVARPDGGPVSQHDRVSTVKSVIDALDDGDGASEPSVIGTLAGEHDMDPETAEDQIESMKSSGKLEAPADGALRLVNPEEASN